MLQADRRGSACNSVMTRTMVFPLYNRALSIFKKQLFLQQRVALDVLVVRFGHGKLSEAQAHVVSRIPTYALFFHIIYPEQSSILTTMQPGSLC